MIFEYFINLIQTKKIHSARQQTTFTEYKVTKKNKVFYHKYKILESSCLLKSKMKTEKKNIFGIFEIYFQNAINLS